MSFYTYQDLLAVGDDEKKKIDFAYAVIASHKNSDAYKTAEVAEEYYHWQNKTISDYQKFLYSASGQAVPDNYSANYKVKSNYFDIFVSQEVQFLLGNGVTWKESSTANKVGDEFDSKLQELGYKSLVEGVSFGFWNLDHLETFGLTEFAPLYDEEDGALKAGVRFWQIDSTKPLRATLYELDGYTDLIWRTGTGEILNPKRPYILHLQSSEVDGTMIYDGENYPSFPIVPLWASRKKQSQFIGMREQIDAYDLIESGFANDLDDVSQIYWILKNAGGMEEADVAQFMQKLKRTRAVNLEDGVEAEPHTMQIPTEARETLLDRLRTDLFRNAMALDTEKVASGGSVVTAAIRMAYAPLNTKTNEFEYCVQEFLKDTLSNIGIENESPTFTRDMIINESEQVLTVIQAGQYLPEEYVTEKILNILGDGDRAEEILQQIQDENIERFSDSDEPTGDSNPEEPEGTEGQGDSGDNAPQE